MMMVVVVVVVPLLAVAPSPILIDHLLPSPCIPLARVWGINNDEPCKKDCRYPSKEAEEDVYEEVRTATGADKHG